MTTSPTPQELCERLMKWGVCDIPQLLRHDVRTAAATISQLQERVGEFERGWTDVWNANNEGKFHTLTCNASSSGEVVGAPDTGCSCFLGRIIRDQRVNISQLQDRVVELETARENSRKRLVGMATDFSTQMGQLQARVEAQQRDIKQITTDFGAELKAANERIEGLRGVLDPVLDTLGDCAHKFREYEAIHAGKGNVGADVKARANATMAEDCEAAISRARLALTGVGLSPNPDVRQRADE